MCREGPVGPAAAAAARFPRAPRLVRRGGVGAAGDEVAVSAAVGAAGPREEAEGSSSALLSIHETGRRAPKVWSRLRATRRKVPGVELHGTSPMRGCGAIPSSLRSLRHRGKELTGKPLILGIRWRKSSTSEETPSEKALPSSSAKLVACPANPGKGEEKRAAALSRCPAVRRRLREPREACGARRKAGKPKGSAAPSFLRVAEILWSPLEEGPAGHEKEDLPMGEEERGTCTALSAEKSWRTRWGKVEGFLHEIRKKAVARRKRRFPVA